jgi:hypothetical protein
VIAVFVSKFYRFAVRLFVVALLHELASGDARFQWGSVASAISPSLLYKRTHKEWSDRAVGHVPFHFHARVG